MNRELAQYQRHIKDYVNKHKHNLPPEVLEKGRKQTNSSLNLQKKSNNIQSSAAGLVGPLPITKQVLSEEEFNQTQKDTTNNSILPKIQTRQPSHLTQAASPKKFNHYQNPQNNIQNNNVNPGYHRQVQGPPDGNNKRSGYNSDWDVKYQYHPPPKYNKNRPIGSNSNGAINNGGKNQQSQNTNNNQNNSNLNNSDKMKLTAGYGTQV